MASSNSAAPASANGGVVAVRQQASDLQRLAKYYFAYGSNLHIRQMKMRRRCPNSRYIGRTRLPNYRWQINQRGYANIVEAAGQCVDGLVYEIDDQDEAKLDINEGVAKNAYQKRHLPVLLHRAHGPLYRRPVSWIVDKGGPAAVVRRPRGSSLHYSPGPGSPHQHWETDVLVYISLNHTEDSTPKDEYVHRLNLGIADARILGVDEDYIRKCIRPFIRETEIEHGHSSAEPTADAPKSAARGVKRGTPSRTGEPSPARKGQMTNRPDEQTLRRVLACMIPRASNDNIREQRQAARTRPLPWSSTAGRPFRDLHFIAEQDYGAGWEWRLSM